MSENKTKLLIIIIVKMTRLTAKKINYYCLIIIIITIIVIASSSFLKTIFHIHKPFSRRLSFISKESQFFTLRISLKSS